MKDLKGRNLHVLHIPILAPLKQHCHHYLFVEHGADGCQDVLHLQNPVYPLSHPVCLFEVVAKGRDIKVDKEGQAPEVLELLQAHQLDAVCGEFV